MSEKQTSAQQRISKTQCDKKGILTRINLVEIKNIQVHVHVHVYTSTCTCMYSNDNFMIITKYMQEGLTSVAPIELFLTQASIKL